ncbi:MAG: PAS domain-containing protein [Burkholderiaceae bacterium]|nr:PAS domain-containing protein [Burkholderiaceae bacterium]
MSAFPSTADAPGHASAALPFDPETLQLLDQAWAWAEVDEAGGPPRWLGGNAAFHALLAGDAGTPLRQWLDSAVVQAQAQAQAQHWLELPGPQCQLHLRRIGRHLLLRVAPGASPDQLQQLQQLQQQCEHAAGLLDLTQRLGGLGVWERDVATGTGRWDDQLWQFWGLTPGPQVPSFDEAVRAVHPDDREPLRQSFAQSLQQPGRYECRYRLADSAGRLRHVCSRWEVLADDQGRPTLARGILVDDTETHRHARSADELSAQLQLAVTLADLAIWHRDLGSRQVTTNAQGWRLLGLSPRAGGLPLAEMLALTHPDDRDAIARPMPGLDPALGEERPVDQILRVRHSSGQWRRLLTRRVARRDAGGRLVGQVGVALDVTERIDQQQRALELSRRLEMATAAAGVGVWSVQLGRARDPAADAPPQVRWDEQMRLLHGLPAEREPPRLEAYAQDHVHADDQARVREAIVALIQRGEGRADLDYRIRRPSGELRWLSTRNAIDVDADGRRHLHGVMLDMTERHAAEERLRSAAERVHLAAHGAGIGTWESDQMLEYAWWDEQMFRLRGSEPLPNPVLMAQARRWMHPEDLLANRRRLEQATDSGAPTSAEFRVVWADGTVRWLASRSVAVPGADGQGVRRIGINWDITDARNAAVAAAERELARRESQAKSRMLARISHELRTPLNAVLGFAQLLLHDGPQADAGQWRRRVEQVESSGQHLLALIDDVLDLSSLESGELSLQLEPVALAPLVHDTLPLLELQARQAGVALHTSALDGVVRADRTRLRQVLVNLLSNAIKYNHRGGSVQLWTEPRGERLVLCVRDSGRGMDTAQVARLFEPFNRLGAEREGISGTGIGLAIVRAAVQQMGGQVQVHSQPGQGSCFEVSLAPAGEPLPPRSAVPVLAAHLQPLQQAASSLLYIEDNEVNLLIVQEMVARRPDLRLHAAADGAQGLALARQLQPGLVLLDMQLPDIDGHEVLRQLRADPATAALRCIALSANALPEDMARALAAGFDDYWTKPLDLRAFMAALERLFGPPPAA